MRVRVLRNPGTPLLKKLGAEDRRDELVEDAEVDVSNSLGEALIKQGVAELPDAKGVAKAAEIKGVQTVVVSPLKDSSAEDAKTSITRMTSKDKLQAVIDGDARTTVVDAAKARLTELG